MKVLRLRRFLGKTAGERRSPEGLLWEKVETQGEVIINIPGKGERGDKRVEFTEPNLSYSMEEWRQLFIWVETGSQPLVGKAAEKDKELKEVKKREEKIANLERTITQLKGEVTALRKAEDKKMKGEK